MNNNFKILEIAFKYYGLKEIQGEQDNPIIVNFFKEIGHSWVKDDETAWCSAFINYVALKAGFERSGKLNARSWLNVGKKVDKPELGDIVVFWREDVNSWKGHVGLYINHDDKYIYCLGGNQSNQVNITAYPKERLLSYIRLEILK